MEKIRNFTIIAHIDHGKSTLADRMIQVTKTVSDREMSDRILDDMELEKERGITIKMRPVTMGFGGYKLNLIDTPGHIDFYYEVSRALKAVEGTILLVDATQGVQAQTLTTLNMAKELNLPIIPVLTKIDSPIARVDDISEEVALLLDCDLDEIKMVSGKTGEGVEELLQHLIETFPAPSKSQDSNDFRSLIFDFHYSNHTGVNVFTRVLDGEIKKGDVISFVAAKEKFTVIDVGVFKPEPTSVDSLKEGEIGYVVTGIKRPGVANVGDTLITHGAKTEAYEGYEKPSSVVWASIFPESQDDFTNLRDALERLQLSDSSFSFAEESSGSLGRGFRCGFLGMLHLEIITERLKREFRLELVVTLPSITYRVTKKNGEELEVYSAAEFPHYGDIASVDEPWIEATIIVPKEYLSGVVQLLFEHESTAKETVTFSDERVQVKADVPLRELMRNFFDELKSVSSGFASLSYEFDTYKPANVVKMNVLLAEEEVPAFARIVSAEKVDEEGKAMVEKLYEVVPQQMFKTKIQASAAGRIVSSKTLSALRKDVTGHLYGGDITRKMKLREKQKKGKKKMQERGKVNLSHDTFLKVLKS